MNKQVANSKIFRLCTSKLKPRPGKPRRPAPRYSPLPATVAPDPLTATLDPDVMTVSSEVCDVSWLVLLDVWWLSLWVSPRTLLELVDEKDDDMDEVDDSFLVVWWYSVGTGEGFTAALDAPWPRPMLSEWNTLSAWPPSGPGGRPRAGCSSAAMAAKAAARHARLTACRADIVATGWPESTSANPPRLGAETPPLAGGRPRSQPSTPSATAAIGGRPAPPGGVGQRAGRCVIYVIRR